MPRRVVPIASPPHCRSSSRSSSRCQGKMTWARSLSIRFSATCTPRLREHVDFVEQSWPG